MVDLNHEDGLELETPEFSDEEILEVKGPYKYRDRRGK